MSDLKAQLEKRHSLSQLSLYKKMHEKLNKLNKRTHMRTHTGF